MAFFHHRSLAARLTLSSAFVLPIILIFSAYSLDRAFKQSLINAEQQALEAQLYSLMGAAEPEGHSLYLPEMFAEPRFNRPQSGLYGVVVNADHAIVWGSGSYSHETALPGATQEPLSAGRETFLQHTYLHQKRHFFLSFDSLWETENEDALFRFIVIHDQAQFQKELNGYRDALLLWLIGISLIFIAALFFITRWGLRPLQSLARELEKFQQGQNNQLEGQYPSEISPVIRNLNDVLTSEQAQRQRYKNTLSDLAHSLKTPLAIIRAELSAGTLNKQQAIDEQITRMSDIIQHQLQRATLTTTTHLHIKTPLAPTITRLASALNKVFLDKHISVDISIPEHLNFPGDESDALEIFGNILENAFKYGKDAIVITTNENETDFSISIADNGPGIPDAQKKTLLARGARADTSTQGQGIGLSIVVDMLSSYQAELTVGNSAIGGAEFTLTFPV